MTHQALGESADAVRVGRLDAHIGARLRLYRRGARMSMASVAAAIRITPQQLQKYETGKNRIPASRLFELSQILKVPIGSFFEEAGEQPVGELADLLATVRIRELVLSFLQIDDVSARKLIVSLTQTLAAKRTAE